MFGKITRRKSDILFSQFLRKKRKWRCEKCGKLYEEKSMNFGVSHFWPRRNENTRFDEKNCDVLCNYPCHQYFESHRTEYEQWKQERMGEKEYKLLMFRAHQYKKRDDKLDIIIWKQELKKLSV